MSPALSVVIPFLLYNIGFLIFLSHIKYKKGIIYFQQSNNYVGCCIVLCLLTFIFATYDGDWWHYKEIVKELHNNPNNITHLEAIHVFIIQYLSLGENYIWRLIIWGLCLLFTYLSFKNLKISNLLTWCSYIVLFALYHYSTGRVAVAIAVQFYGFTYIIIKPKKLKFVLIGSFWIIISLFFHKSAFLTIIPLIASLIPLKKWQLVLFFLAVPLVVSLFKKYLIMYILAGNASDGMMRYLDQHTSETGIAVQIMNLFFKLTIFGIYIIGGIKIFINKMNVPSYVIIIFRYITFLIIEYLVVYGALTASGIGNSAISSRILPMLLLPLVILYSNLLSHRKGSLVLLLCGILGIIAINYRLMYAFYLYTLGTGI